MGSGPLEVHGHRSSTSGNMTADQIVQHATATTAGGIGDLHYETGFGHQHWHFEPFDHYELRTLDRRVWWAPTSSRASASGITTTTAAAVKRLHRLLQAEPTGRARGHRGHLARLGRLLRPRQGGAGHPDLELHGVARQLRPRAPREREHERRPRAGARVLVRQQRRLGGGPDRLVERHAVDQGAEDLPRHGHVRDQHSAGDARPRPRRRPAAPAPARPPRPRRRCRRRPPRPARRPTSWGTRLRRGSC